MPRKTIRRTPRRTVKSAQVKPAVKSSQSCSMCTVCNILCKFWRSLLLMVLIVIGLLIYFKGFIVAALVNGVPVFRHTLVRELEKQAGKSALESLVTQKLVQQEARKEKVTVTDDEINEEIKKIEEILKQQNQTLDSALALRGMSKNDLIGQIKLQKMVEKMAAEDVAVSDEELNQYIEDNKASFGTTEITQEVKDSIKEQLVQEKISSKEDEWLTNLKEKAKIYYFLKL